MTKDEGRILGNELYAAIYPLLMRYEGRGSNAHARAQIIAERVKNECVEWIESQPWIESQLKMPSEKDRTE